VSEVTFDVEERAALILGSPRDAGWIYYICSPDMRRIKIGFTKGPVTKRLKALQTGSPTELLIFAQHHGGPSVERELHAIFADDWIHGEWFSASEAMFQHMTLVCWLMAVDADLRGELVPLWAKAGLQTLAELAPLPRDIERLAQ
jgi:hypothetical protein